MSITIPTIAALVRAAASNDISVPEIQRGHRWAKSKVKALADTLYHGEPLPSIMLWDPPNGERVTARTTTAGTPSLWIVDGQQRITAMCTLFGQTPGWLREPVGFKIQFRPDLELFEAVRTNGHGVATELIIDRKVGRPHEYVDVAEVLSADDETLIAIARNLGRGSEDKVYTYISRLTKLRAIGAQAPQIQVFSVPADRLVTVFDRINRNGVKVTSAEVTLAMGADSNPGLVANRINPFLEEMNAKRFQIDTTLLLRTLASLWLGTSRFERIKADEWGQSGSGNPGVLAAWKRTERAWRAVVDYLHSYGLHRTEDIPARAVLLPVVVVAALWPESLNDRRALRWMLRAIRCDHYTGSALSTANADVKALLDMHEVDAPYAAAIGELDSRLRYADRHRFKAAEFMRTPTGSSARNMQSTMYAAFAASGAQDWVTGERLALRGQDGDPQWHHIFPKEHLSQHGVPRERHSVPANMALASAASNLAYRADSPSAYLSKSGADLTRLAAQCVPTDPALLDVAAFEQFLEERAGQLAERLNRLMDTGA